MYHTKIIVQPTKKYHNKKKKAELKMQCHCNDTYKLMPTI